MSLTTNPILPNSHLSQEDSPSVPPRPSRTPPRWTTEGFTRPTMPDYATRGSYLASPGPVGTWPSPAGLDSSFITVTATSPGPPIGKPHPHKTDYISYHSPASHLLSDHEARHSRPSSPSPSLSSVQPQTPARIRHSSISSSGTRSITYPSPHTHTHTHTLSQTSTPRQTSPTSHEVGRRASRDDLPDTKVMMTMDDDPRSIMTEEALEVGLGQPLLGNMMDALEKSRSSSTCSSGLPVIKNEPIVRLAPPIWTMTRSYRSSSSSSPTTTTKPQSTSTTTDTDQPASTSKPSSHDPFVIPTTSTSTSTSSYASRGRLDRSRVSFPTSRTMSQSGDDEGEDEDEDDDEEEQHQGDSGISLNEAEVRGTMGGLMRSPDQRVEEMDVHGVLQDKTGSGAMLGVKQEQAGVPTLVKPAVVTNDNDIPITPTETSQSQDVRTTPPPTRTDHSSLPRLLKPRLRINFAWDDMTIPSSITIVSTKGEDLPDEPKEPSKSASELAPKSASSTKVGPPNRTRTSSLNWATGIAMDTATGVAKYGLSYVPGPIRRRALRDRQWASETG